MAGCAFETEDDDNNTYRTTVGHMLEDETHKMINCPPLIDHNVLEENVNPLIGQQVVYESTIIFKNNDNDDFELEKNSLATSNMKTAV